jgi:hypothetical protein
MAVDDQFVCKQPAINTLLTIKGQPLPAFSRDGQSHRGTAGIMAAFF